MKIWEPSADRVNNSNIISYMTRVERDNDIKLPDYHALYQWSLDENEAFWQSVWDYCEIISSKKADKVIVSNETMSESQWFPGARLNFAENLLRHRDDRDALVFWGEASVKRKLSFKELYSLTAKTARALKELGVVKGDRVAAFMPNMPETIIAMLATTSIGAIWSSCSPDFGVTGVLDRFGQIEPKVIFTADGYFFKEGAIDSLQKISEIQGQLQGLQKVVVTPYVNSAPDISVLKNGALFSDFISSEIDPEIDFAQLPFDHPLYIMYSSGTTGKPKCIVHRAGGVLLEHIKEHQLHVDLKREDRIFYQTTCGWMMWNWLVSALASGSTVILYDGAPFLKKAKVLWDMVESEKVTIFGTNPKYLTALEKQNLTPNKSHDLSSLRTVLSTGSPLAPENYDYVYKHISADINLSSISGGTDILGCFALGSPTLPVYRGELQCRSLGLKVEVYNSEGIPVVGEKGELVCSAPFPSMPVYFWNDPDKQKYKDAYFSKFDNVWAHGDYVELTERGTMIFHGRSDAVLNPGGIRIGTAEIYSQVEKLPEIAESLVVGQKWQSDVRVILFVILSEGVCLDEELKKKIRHQIRNNTTPFHVPKKIIQVSDIPRTRSGKIVELAVKNIINNEEVKNTEGLSNPEALEQFRDMVKLSED